MTAIIEYLFNYLPQIVSTTEFALFVCSLALCVVTALLVWVVIRRR